MLSGVGGGVASGDAVVEEVGGAGEAFGAARVRVFAGGASQEGALVGEFGLDAATGDAERFRRVIGGAVLAAGWALISGRRWGRGVAVFANLLLLGVAWYIHGSDQPLYAALVAVAALVVLGLLFSPAAVQWVTRD